MRPVVGRILAIRARYHQRQLLKILVPLVEERMRQCEDKEDLDDGPVCSSLFLSIFLGPFSVNRLDLGRCNPMADSGSQKPRP